MHADFLGWLLLVPDSWQEQGGLQRPGIDIHLKFHGDLDNTSGTVFPRLCSPLLKAFSATVQPTLGCKFPSPIYPGWNLVHATVGISTKTWGSSLPLAPLLKMEKSVAPGYLWRHPCLLLRENANAENKKCQSTSQRRKPVTQESRHFLIKKSSYKFWFKYLKRMPLVWFLERLDTSHHALLNQSMAHYNFSVIHDADSEQRPPAAVPSFLIHFQFASLHSSEKIRT